MSSGIGILLVCLISMCVSWFIFGRRERNGGWVKFSYWLKSTILTAAALVVWFHYQEPGLDFFYSSLFAFAFGGFMNLCRSQVGLIF